MNNYKPNWIEINDLSSNKIQYKLTINDTSNNLLDSSCNTLYKFILSNNAKEKIEKEIYSMNDEYNSFIFDKPWNYVFIYGKKVNDFHTLIKDKLYTINFSATQEIDKIQQAEKAKLAAAEAEIVALKSKVTSLETTVADLVARLEALESN